MDKIQKPSNSECYAASSESFTFYMMRRPQKSLCISRQPRIGVARCTKWWWVTQPTKNLFSDNRISSRRSTGQDCATPTAGTSSDLRLRILSSYCNFSARIKFPLCFSISFCFSSFCLSQCYFSSCLSLSFEPVPLTISSISRLKDALFLLTSKVCARLSHELEILLCWIQPVFTWNVAPIVYFTSCYFWVHHALQHCRLCCGYKYIK
jgi:hypothetical protein